MDRTGQLGPTHTQKNAPEKARLIDSDATHTASSRSSERAQHCRHSKKSPEPNCMTAITLQEVLNDNLFYILSNGYCMIILCQL